MGCIDCTHVAIFPPGNQNEHIFVNRKGYHSINTQLVSIKHIIGIYLILIIYLYADM